MQSTLWTILIVLLILIAVILFILYRLGQKMQLRQAESQKVIEAYSQVVSLLIIDKKKMRLKKAPFPAEVYEQTPFYLKHMSVYVIKAKLGPKIVNLMCDKAIFEQLPLKATVQGKISGAYITEIIKGGVLTDKEIERRRKAKLKAEKKAAKN